MKRESENWKRRGILKRGEVESKVEMENEKGIDR